MIQTCNEAYRTRHELNAINLHNLIRWRRETPDMAQIRASASFNRTEPTACIHHRDVARFIKDVDKLYEDSTMESFTLCSVPRSVCEFIGDWVQLVVGLCIHTSKKVLFLELNRPSPITSNYIAGTLTFPEGHLEIPQNLPAIRTPAIIALARKAALRELYEEVIMPWNPEAQYNGDFTQDIGYGVLAETLHTAVPHVYYDEDGVSNARHMELVFDLKITESERNQLWLEALEHDTFESNEPEKHGVKVLTYRDMVHYIPSTDYLGAFVVRHMRGAAWWEAWLDHTEIGLGAYDPRRIYDAAYPEPRQYFDSEPDCTDEKCKEKDTPEAKTEPEASNDEAGPSEA